MTTPNDEPREDPVDPNDPYKDQPKDTWAWGGEASESQKGEDPEAPNPNRWPTADDGTGSWGLEWSQDAAEVPKGGREPTDEEMERIRRLMIGSVLDQSLPGPLGAIMKFIWLFTTGFTNGLMKLVDAAGNVVFDGWTSAWDWLTRTITGQQSDLERHAQDIDLNEVRIDELEKNVSQLLETEYGPAKRITYDSTVDLTVDRETGEPVHPFVEIICVGGGGGAGGATSLGLGAGGGGAGGGGGGCSREIYALADLDWSTKNGKKVYQVHFVMGVPDDWGTPEGGKWPTNPGGTTGVAPGNGGDGQGATETKAFYVNSKGENVELCKAGGGQGGQGGKPSPTMTRVALGGVGNEANGGDGGQGGAGGLLGGEVKGGDSVNKKPRGTLTGAGGGAAGGFMAFPWEATDKGWAGGAGGTRNGGKGSANGATTAGNLIGGGGGGGTNTKNQPNTNGNGGWPGGGGGGGHSRAIGGFFDGGNGAPGAGWLLERDKNDDTAKGSDYPTYSY